jgi:hypothetical protein
LISGSQAGREALTVSRPPTGISVAAVATVQDTHFSHVSVQGLPSSCDRQDRDRPMARWGQLSTIQTLCVPFSTARVNICPQRPIASIRNPEGGVRAVCSQLARRSDTVHHEESACHSGSWWISAEDSGWSSVPADDVALLPVCRIHIPARPPADAKDGLHDDNQPSLTVVRNNQRGLGCYP